MSRSSQLSFITFIAILASTSAAYAHGQSPWLYDTRTMTAGHVEYEQMMTWKTNKNSDPEYDEIRIRHEIEWGVTDRLQMAVYFADWRYKKTATTERTYFHDVAVEAIYQLQAPTPDQLGAAIYGELKYGDDFVELETKILLEKALDQVNLLYNFTLEAEWEGEKLDDDKGVIENAFAITYQPDPSTTLGLQAIWEIEFPGWTEQGEDVISVGPSIAWQSDGWWLSVSPLFQVTSVDSEPDMQVRLKFAIDF